MPRSQGSASTLERRLRTMGSALVIGAALLVGVVCGGKSPVAPATPPPTTLPPATLADLSAQATSPDSGRSIGCRETIHFKVTVTNAGATGVAVSGIRKHSSALHGNCDAGQDHTYTVPVTAGPRTTTTVVANRALYSNGSGCCIGSTTCSGVCTFRETFTVVTALGDVPAGNFQYEIVFGDCERCSGTLASGRCRRAQLLR